MIRKSQTELELVRTYAPMATVEIDLDSIPSEYRGYGELAKQALAGFAERSPALRATVYVYEGPSINFGQPGHSAFFGVAGGKRVLAELYAVFTAVRGLQARYSDSIQASRALSQYHLEGGKLWRPLEEGVWYADGADDPIMGDESVETARLNAEILRAAKGPGESRTGDWDKVFELLTRHYLDPNTIVCPNSQTSLLTYAATEAAPEACERLLQLGAGPRNGGNTAGRSALTMMVWLRNGTWGKKHREVVELLAPASVNHQDSDGRTALMFAARGVGVTAAKRGNPGIIDQLMRLGADPSIIDHGGRTALMHAVRFNDASPTSANHDVVRLLEAHSLDFAAKAWFSRHHSVAFSDAGEMRIEPQAASGQTRAIRQDARIGTITKKMEDHFGLPEGSVALVDGKGKILRDHDTIGTLRKRHN